MIGLCDDGLVEGYFASFQVHLVVCFVGKNVN